MSIKQCLADRVVEGRMFQVTPLIPNPKGQLRSVWAEKTVFAQLDRATAGEKFRRESGRLRRKLEGIATGNRIVVGNRRDKQCDMKRLEPTSKEVWEIRERAHPSIRLFSRFVERDWRLLISNSCPHCLLLLGCGARLHFGLFGSARYTAAKRYGKICF